VTKPNHFRYTGTVAVPPSIPWEDVTEGPLGAPLSSRAAVWGDHDGDFDPDLYVVAGSGDTSRLFRNDDGVFTEVDGAALAGDGHGRSAAWGDYDNDGDLDLYVVNDGTPNALLRNVGGVFEDATGGSGPLGDESAGRDAAWADYDGDGHLDLYLSNADAGNRLFRNLGDGTFEPPRSLPGQDGREQAPPECGRRHVRGRDGDGGGGGRRR